MDCLFSRAVGGTGLKAGMLVLGRFFLGTFLGWGIFFILFVLPEKSGVFESRKSELRVLGKFMRKDRGKIRAQHVFFRDPSK